jgi:hypothetical protein
MFLRAKAAAVPVEFAFSSFNTQIIDAGVAGVHQSVRIEVPIFIAIGAIPLANVVMPFIGKAYCDAGVSEGSEFFDQPILVLVCPFVVQK